MKCLNVNEKEINKAIDVVNKQFEDNIYIKEYCQQIRYFIRQIIFKHFNFFANVIIIIILFNF